MRPVGVEAVSRCIAFSRWYFSGVESYVLHVQTS